MKSFSGKWDLGLETLLLDAVEHFKPLGPMKHIAILLIRSYLKQRAQIDVPAAEIRDKLSVYWNLDALDPDYNIGVDENEDEISDFELPDEFDDEIAARSEELDAESANPKEKKVGSAKKRKRK